MFRNRCFENRLLLNPDKTKLVVCGRRQRLQNLPGIRLSLLGKELIPARVVNDLGVTFDSSLTFHELIVKTVFSFFSSLVQINYVKHVFDTCLFNHNNIKVESVKKLSNFIFQSTKTDVMVFLS